MKPQPHVLRATPQTRRLAERSDHLAALVWQKAIANSSPQVRRMLVTFAHLRRAPAALLPERADPPAPWTEDRLQRLIGQAEAILTDGFSQSMLDQAASDGQPGSAA